MSLLGVALSLSFCKDQRDNLAGRDRPVLRLSASNKSYK
jgi:hypothetical protein